MAIRETVYEVHFWRASGRVLVIHIPNFGVSADQPILTEAHVTGEAGSYFLYENTFIMANALAEAGKPAGALVEHRTDGTVHVHYDQAPAERVDLAQDRGYQAYLAARAES